MKVATDLLREAKAAGCPAFRSGRVYRDELLRWFEEHPISRKRPEAPSLEGPEFWGVPLDWERRRELLFLLREFLDSLYDDGLLSAAEYRELGDKTVPLIIKLGRAWDAGIDEAGYRDCWKELCDEAAIESVLAWRENRLKD